MTAIRLTSRRRPARPVTLPSSWDIGASLALCVLSAFGARPAWAAFVNGVETFDGTSFDTSTWEWAQLHPAVTRSQSNAFRIVARMSSFDSVTADYTTRSLTVGLGQSVAVDIKLNGMDPSTYDPNFSIYLTSNDKGTQLTTGFDKTYYSLMSFVSTGPLGIYPGVKVGNHGQNEQELCPPQTLLTTYRYQIRRDSPTVVTYTVWGVNTGGSSQPQLLGTRSIDWTAFGPVAEPMYVSLAAQHCDVTFDNVTVAPEPGALSFCLITTASLRGRPRRRRNQTKHPRGGIGLQATA